VKRLPNAVAPAVAALACVPVAVAPASAFAQVAYTGTFAFLVGMAWWGARGRTGRALTAHALVAGALTVWLLGDLCYAVLVWLLGPLGEVSVCDVLWVGGYPLLAVGLVRMTHLRAPGRLREGLLDGLAMSIAVAALFWYLMILPTFRADGVTLPVVVTAFYPVGDVLLFAAAAILVFTPGQRHGPTRYLVAALVLTFVGDVGISAVSAFLPEFDPGHLDGILLVANSLIVAALWDRRPDLFTPSHHADQGRLHPARVVFLGVALLTLPAITHLRQDGIFGRLVELVPMTVLTMIILLRFTLVVRAQERGRAALAHRATHDQLTGLVNRQELHRCLDAALHHDPAGPVVHFLDLDGFKPVNDRYGHAVGDFVLAEVGRRLRAAVRPEDTVARLGGDEFVVVSLSAATAASVLDRLREVAATPLIHEGELLTVGISIGTAFARELPQPTSDSLLAAADARMYRVKADSRAVRGGAPTAPVLATADESA
jgi:diguanylate cyclase (GGDEF)-like protein